MHRARLVALASLAALAFAATATSQVRMPQAQAIVDPGHRLAPFHEALQRTRAGGERSITRILYLGDSAVVCDGLTSELRRQLQTRFGDAGHGFMLPGAPWQWYRHHDVRHSGEGWRHATIMHPPTDRLFGLPFVLTSSTTRAVARYATMRSGEIGTRLSHVEAMYLERPNGGTFEIQVDSDPPVTVPTAASERHAAYRAIDFADGAHEIEVRTHGDGLVEMFGVVLERRVPGVVLDAVGVNGAHARSFLAAETTMLREHMQHRAYDLVAIQLGTNMSTNLAPSSFANHLRTLVRRVRDARPEAACLLVGPFDRRGRRANGTPGTPAYIPAITREIERIAADQGCAFWNTYAAMGGENSYLRWESARMAGGDGSHLAQSGYSRLARMLDAALVGALPHSP